VLQPPHKGDCTFHADAPGDAATFDEVSALRAEIARLREERRWVPVGERLPEVGESVLGVHRGYVSEFWYTKLGFETERGAFKVTHWQPLPPGPEGNANG
jgi:hypothetical protein